MKLQLIDIIPDGSPMLPSGVRPRHGLLCQWNEGEGLCGQIATRVLSRPPRDAFLCDQHAHAAIQFILVNRSGEQQNYVRLAEQIQPDIDLLNALLNRLLNGMPAS